MAEKAEKAVRGGSFCGPVGAVAKTSAGTDVTCILKPDERNARWRSPDGRRAPRRSRATGEPRRKPTILEMNRRQLLAAAKAASILLTRGEPDDAIRSKLSDAARGTAPASAQLADARSVAPVAVPEPVFSISHTQDPEGDCDLGEAHPEDQPCVRTKPTTEEPPVMPEPAPTVVDVTRHTTRPAKLVWEDSQDGMFHTYSVSANALRDLGPDTQIDMGDGEPLQDLLTDVAMGTGTRKIPAAEAPARYRAIAARLPEGSRARRVVERLAADVDGPPVEPMQLPENVHPAIRDLVRAVEGLPAFRNPANDRPYEAYQRVREIAERAAGGARRLGLRDDVYRLYNIVHEMNFDRGSQEFNYAVQAAHDALRPQPGQGA